MRIAIDIVDGSPQDLLIRNIWMDFNNIDLPLNYALPSFNDGFKKAQLGIETGPYKLEVYLALFYDSFLEEEKFQAYTSNVVDEFRNAFVSCLKLANSYLNTTTKEARYHGSIENLLVSVRLDYAMQFLKYAPFDGFGSLLTRDFVAPYAGDDPSSGFMIDYVISNNQQERAKLSLLFSEAREYDGQPMEINVDVNEMFNRTGPIQPSQHGSSQIIIDVDKTAQTSKGTFFLTVQENPYETEEDEYRTRVTCVLTQAIDNMTVKVNIKTTAHQLDSLNCSDHHSWHMQYDPNLSCKEAQGQVLKETYKPASHVGTQTTAKKVNVLRGKNAKMTCAAVLLWFFIGMENPYHQSMLVCKSLEPLLLETHDML
ncbi:MAG: hypothetical protein QHH24_00210 [Candidatus Bathyarchaeota archaeon]|nr:hypothetical protein [Candidatus Bathyarchaeota archaeon]